MYNTLEYYGVKLLLKMMEYVLGGAHNTHFENIYAKKVIWHGKTRYSEEFHVK